MLTVEGNDRGKKGMQDIMDDYGGMLKKAKKQDGQENEADEINWDMLTTGKDVQQDWQGLTDAVD